MRQFSRFLIAVLVILPLVAVGGLSQTTQTVNVNVNQSLYLDCTASTAITYTVMQADIEATQPIDIGDWACNVDALTNYILSANMAISTPPTNVSNASANDFSEDCNVPPSGGGTPVCGAGGTFGPITLGTGGNSAGTLGADFGGDVFVNLSDWDVPSPSGTVNGTITYSVSDSTP